MADILSGDEFSVVFDCGEAPDDTPTFTVYEVNGTPIPSLTDVNAEVINVTEALCVIPDSENELTGTAPVSRFVRLTYEIGGRVFKKMANYRILPFLPITVTWEYINSSLLGNVGPTDPAAYDIYSAYLTAKRAVPSIDDHLVGEYAAEANRLIALYAARGPMGRIGLSLNQREKSHDEEIERFRGLKFEDLLAGLTEEIASLILFLNGGTTAEPLPAIMLTTPTDPVTGGGEA